MTMLQHVALLLCSACVCILLCGLFAFLGDMPEAALLAMCGLALALTALHASWPRKPRR